MIIDSSALVALVLEEPDAGRVGQAILEAPRLGIGAPTLAETGIVLANRLDRHSELLLSRIVDGLELSVIPFSAAHGRLSRDAFLRYGRGRHPAALNFGDCLTYAVAKLADEPLLFLGDDFARTDLASALARF